MRIVVLTHFFWWLLMAAACAPVRAGYFAMPLNAEDGLPHNAVYGIVQSPDGYVWVATSGGLARYDGFEFQRVDAAAMPGGESDSIRQLGLDSDGFVLAAPHAGGLVQVGRQTVELHPLSRALAGERIAGVHPVEDALWISLYGGAILRWSNGELTEIGKQHRTGSGRVTMVLAGGFWVAVGDFFGLWRDDKFEEIKLPLRPSYQMATSRDGIWVAGYDGLVKVQNRSPVERFSWPPEMSAVRTMLEDSSGTLWLGTVDSGLFRLEGGEFVRAPATHPEIACLMEDREKNLWVGTIGGGLYLLKKEFVTLFDSGMGLPQDVSFSICESPDGAVWFANRFGGLLRLRDQKLIAAAEGVGGRAGPTVVCPGPNGGLYVGSERGLSWVPDAEAGGFENVMSFERKAVRCLFLSRAGELLASSTSGLFGRCAGANFEPEALEMDEEAMVSALAEDDEGRVIAGTTSGALFRQDHGRFGRMQMPVRRRLSTILAIAPHPDGTIWVGTSADGLLRVKDATVTFYKTEHGLPDNSISQLVWENETNLWAGSRSGIWRVTIDPTNVPDRVYPQLLGRNDGVPSSSCIGAYQPTSFRGSDGRLWFATRRGAVRVNPAIFAAAPSSIPVHLEEVEIDGKIYPAPDRIRTIPLSKTYRFSYTALLYSAPERLRFRYRLEGHDRDWVNAGAAREAIYTELPPGKYKFRVQARSPRGEWFESRAALALFVPAAWWQLAWVQVAMVLGAAGLLIGGARAAASRRFLRELAVIGEKQALESERARIARDLHDELGAGLTHLGHLGHFGGHAESKDELRAALATVAVKARNLAVQMDAIVWTVDPKNDSLPRLAGYLSHFGQEFFRGLPMRFRVDRPEELPAIPVAPDVRHHVLMVAKEAFANAAKHSAGTEVWLRINLDGETLRLEVADNGTGMKPNKGLPPGDGLANMASRARDLGGQLSIHSEDGKGARIIIEAPLTNKWH